MSLCLWRLLLLFLLDLRWFRLSFGHLLGLRSGDYFLLFRRRRNLNDLGLLRSRCLRIVNRCSIRSLLRELTSAEHTDLAGRRLIDTESDLLVLVVVQGVEITQEKLTQDEVLVVEFVQFVFSNCELALALGLVQEFARADLEDGVAALLSTRDEETDRLQLLLDVVALCLFGFTEVSVTSAIKARYDLVPLLSQVCKQWRWDRNEVRSRINHCREVAEGAHLGETAEKTFT